MRFALIPLLALALAGCAGRAPAGAPPASRDAVLADELRGLELGNLYETLEKLRPEWLRSRGQRSPTNRESELPLVYLDNSRYGELQSLRNLRAGEVTEIHWLSGPVATYRFGTGHSGGVILVLTR